MNVQTFKLIFKGRLEFGTQRSYDMALKHWQTRLETYFKTDILFKHEQALSAEDFSFSFPQQVIMGTEKQWRSSMDLLREIAQFAIVGKLSGWCVNDGCVLSECTVEPTSDKVAISEYRRGCALVQNAEGMTEATEALNRAIGKYERHALAYERRGYVNYKLKNYKDALYDFSKSIDINSNNPEPFYGRAKVKMLKNDWVGAAEDFDMAIKRSIALQPIFWLARLKKGESLYHNKDFKGAIAELQLYLKRSFVEKDPNFQRRRRAWFLLGKALLETNDTKGRCAGILPRPASGCPPRLRRGSPPAPAMGVIRRQSQPVRWQAY
jgi:tetratricopeptide (TPR) repeat protein